MRWLSVVIPVRNEVSGIVQVLEPLQGLREQIEIIVVDGGSEDGTARLALPLADQVIDSAPGRARQMNAGAALASGEVLLFLHADTQLPDGFVGMIKSVIPAPHTVIPVPYTVIPAKAGIHSDPQPAPSPEQASSAQPNPTMDPRVREDDEHPYTVIPAKAGIHSDLQPAPSPEQASSAHPNPTMDPRVREDDGTVQWGRFDVRLVPSSPTLNLVAWMMNHRSRITGICTGDQAIFVRRDLFNQLGGYANIPLMEDIDLSKRLKRTSPPASIRQPLTTSSRRWQQHGVLKTIILMWWLRLQYWVGVSPARLAEKYYPSRHSGN